MARLHPKNYDGNELTSQRLNDVLPKVLGSVGRVYKQRPDLVLAAWPEIIGEQLAPMTKAVSFEDGVLHVKVKNSTLHSLLSRNDRPRILRSLREKFPNTAINKVVFRIG